MFRALAGRVVDGLEGFADIPGGAGNGQLEVALQGLPPPDPFIGRGSDLPWRGVLVQADPARVAAPADQAHQLGLGLPGPEAGQLPVAVSAVVLGVLVPDKLP